MAKTVDDATTAYRRDPPTLEKESGNQRLARATKISSAISRWGPNADTFLFYAAAAAKSVGGFTGQKTYAVN
jgi:hypothetical protein